LAQHCPRAVSVDTFQSLILKGSFSLLPFPPSEAAPQTFFQRKKGSRGEEEIHRLSLEFRWGEIQFYGLSIPTIYLYSDVYSKCSKECLETNIQFSTDCSLERTVKQVVYVNEGADVVGKAVEVYESTQNRSEAKYHVFYGLGDESGDPFWNRTIGTRFPEAFFTKTFGKYRERGCHSNFTCRHRVS